MEPLLPRSPTSGNNLVRPQKSLILQIHTSVIPAAIQMELIPISIRYPNHPQTWKTHARIGLTVQTIRSWRRTPRRSSTATATHVHWCNQPGSNITNLIGPPIGLICQLHPKCSQQPGTIPSPTLTRRLVRTRWTSNVQRKNICTGYPGTPTGNSAVLP